MVEKGGDIQLLDAQVGSVARRSGARVDLSLQPHRPPGVCLRGVDPDVEQQRLQRPFRRRGQAKPFVQGVILQQTSDLGNIEGVEPQREVGRLLRVGQGAA